MTDTKDTVLAVLNEPPQAVLARLNYPTDRNQREVAELLGVSQMTVSEWARGKKNMSRHARYTVLAQLGFIRNDGGGWLKLC